MVYRLPPDIRVSAVDLVAFLRLLAVCAPPKAAASPPATWEQFRDAFLAGAESDTPAVLERAKRAYRQLVVTQLRAGHVLDPDRPSQAWMMSNSSSNSCRWPPVWWPNGFSSSGSGMGRTKGNPAILGKGRISDED